MLTPQIPGHLTTGAMPGPGLRPMQFQAEIIQRAAQICREGTHEDAAAMTFEQGKPSAQAKLEILRG
jgi:acyl-CoA reductase-like NAD-dependent aldehyde dehydrogenase